MAAIGVLVMAYGGPEALDDVEPYLREVRGGRPTPPELVEAVRQRYAAIGGRSPIRERTEAQARALQAALDADGAGFRVTVGMRHWRPTIREAVTCLAARGVERAVGLVMAPHESRMSVGRYYAAVAETGAPLAVAPIRHWHLRPGYLAAVRARVAGALARLPEPQRAAAPIVFTAHSLPRRILEDGDPYPAQLAETAAAIMGTLDARPYHVAYQSASATGEPWLGPDVGEVVARLAREGSRAVVVAPIGFVCEHVEVLYDLDIELRHRAGELGVRLERAAMVGDAPELMRDLAVLVRETAAGAGWR